MGNWKCFGTVVDYISAAPNDTAYKWWSCHSGHRPLCKLCQTFPPQQWGPDLQFLGKPAIRTRWMSGAAPHKINDCVHPDVLQRGRAVMACQRSKSQDVRAAT